MADAPFYDQESDPQIRALLQQISTGALPDWFAYQLATQIDQRQLPGDPLLPQISYRPSLDAIVNQLGQKRVMQPLFPGMSDQGPLVFPDQPATMTPEEQADLDAVVKKFPTQQDSTPFDFVSDFLPHILTAAAPLLLAAGPALGAELGIGTTAADALIGAGVGATSTGLSGGNPLTGALISGATAGAGAELSGVFGPASAGAGSSAAGAGGGAAGADVLATSDLGALSGAGPMAGATGVELSDLGGLSGPGAMTGASPTPLTAGSDALASGLSATSPITGASNDVGASLSPSTAGSSAFGGANGAGDAFGAGSNTAFGSTASGSNALVDPAQFNFASDPSITGGGNTGGFTFNTEPIGDITTPATTGANVQDLPFDTTSGSFNLGTDPMDAAFTPATGAFNTAGGSFSAGNGGLFSGGGIGSDIMGFLKANPGLALSGGGLLLSQLTKPRIPNLSSVQDQLNNLSGTASQLINSETSGVLPPGQETMVQNAINDAKSGIRAKYANLGLSGSTMEQQELNAVDERAVAQRAQLAQQATQTGLQAAGLQEQIFNAIAGLTLQEDQGLQNAIANFASSAALGAAMRGFKSS